MIQFVLPSPAAGLGEAGPITWFHVKEMVMAKVKLALRGMAIPVKVQFLRQVVTAMTGNANFTTPVPTLASITAAANDLETKYNDAQAARTTAQQKTDVQDNSDRTADTGITQVAAYVENVTVGDAVKIQSAGMEVRAAGAPIGALPAPAGMVATAGDNDGELDLDWDSVRGASSYVVQRSADPPTATSWQTVATFTKSKGTISGLTSGTKYWFRVAAVGAAGQGAFSDPATKIAP